MKRSVLILISLAVFAAAVAYVLFIYEKEEVMPLTNRWEKAFPYQELPEGLVSLRAEDCGTCHKEIYEEWRLATHAHAWTDLQFQAELKKESSPFLCINCHIPLQNQQEFIVDGLINGDIYRPVKRENPHFDPQLKLEGITCASCHVRNKAIVGVHGYEGAPHKITKDSKMLSESLCLGCHNANAVVTPTLACTFQTGDEWKAGPFHEEKNCIDCHMAEIDRPIVEGYPVRKSHRHFFTGSGIPKFDTVQTTVQNGLVFYPEALKKMYKVGESLDFTLKVKNENAGHRVPTGDPERFFLIDLALQNAQGEVLKKEQFRIGEEWEWYPEAKKLSDNNINPGESREYTLKNQLLEAGEYTLSMKVTKHRLSKENAEYNKLGDNYPLYITTYDKTEHFVVN
ncbi:cytochrome c family protein [Marinilongibacter aquaticus]|uniref:cytochrome c family protein n=1 Tax=Marinilongibacter aquaticus TaxID=2975157 RepID=UPI0021BDD9A9|nr:cytochrome c family protein [Marinilongibacter aquaticus]UBM59939.1 cytochrome c family protein [Marinilongibacter aquaticus]